MAAGVDVVRLRQLANAAEHAASSRDQGFAEREAAAEFVAYLSPGRVNAILDTIENVHALIEKYDHSEEECAGACVPDRNTVVADLREALRVLQEGNQGDEE